MSTTANGLPDVFWLVRRIDHRPSEQMGEWFVVVDTPQAKSYKASDYFEVEECTAAAAPADLPDFAARLLSDEVLAAAGERVGDHDLAREAVESAIEAATEGDRRCRVCGCTTLHACVRLDEKVPTQTCCWVEWDLCSACGPDVGKGWRHPGLPAAIAAAGDRG